MPKQERFACTGDDCPHCKALEDEWNSGRDPAVAQRVQELMDEAMILSRNDSLRRQGSNIRLPLPSERKQRRARQQKQQDCSVIMTTEEVAEHLRIDSDQVAKLGLPEMPRKPGGKHRYFRRGVMRWLEDQSNGKAG